MVKVTFYGAAGEVTGSNHLVETGEHTYVVDCGLFQGGDQIAEQNSQAFAYDPSKVEAVIITHAHLDHIGRLPMLVKNGFRGPIFATQATIELTTITLKDALGLMTHRQERSANPLPLLYDQTDLHRTLALFEPVKYRTKQKLFGKDTVTFYDAGHILGSASVLLEAGGKQVAFSGDIGYWPNTLLPKPEAPPQADIVVTEATYGGVQRQERMDRLATVKDAVNWAVDKRGVLLVPAFAIERSQELLFLLHYLFVEHQLPKMPVFLDSPLAIEALEIYERHKELFNREVGEETGQSGDPFTFKGLVLTPTSADSIEINTTPSPKMIVAGSGMMEGGRIHHHLKRYLSHPETLLLVVGYQAVNTLGRKIVDGAKEVQIMDDWIPIHARVEVVDIFSGHADDIELKAWAEKIALNPGGKVAIVHSEPSRAKTFKTELEAIFPHADISVAAHGLSVEI